MAYETCPECGAQKHQLVACPNCGFKRMTVRPPIDRELFDNDEFPPLRPATPPVSSNFENCPTCGTRKHLLMACASCGFSRSSNQERLANKPRYDTRPPRPPRNENPRHSNYPRREAHAPYATPPRSTQYEERYRGEYYGSNLVEQERSNAPVVRWKRTKPAERRSRA